MLSETEKKELKEILINIFGERAKQWDVNDDSVRILTEMLEKGQKCTRAIDSLPRVPGWVPGVTYLPTQIIGALYRLVKHNKNSVLQMCSTVQLSAYGTAFEMASLGLPVSFPICY